jgi:hypothetical protein
MTLIILPGMYLIAERLRRPMRRMFGGKWISFGSLLFPAAGIGNAIGGGNGLLTLILFLAFPILMIITAFKHRAEARNRRRRMKGKADETFIGSWF